MRANTAHAFTGASVLLSPGAREQLRLAWRLFRDKRVSVLKFMLPALMSLYVVSPLDPIPDALLGVGQLDDLGVMVALTMLTVRVLPWLAPREVVDEHLHGMGKTTRREQQQFVRDDEAIDATFTVRA
jgi:uncharacterized membrane protein YkvA (DUF1232 family)